MNRLNIKLTKTTFIFISILSLALALLGQVQPTEDKTRERLEYQLSVDVRLVPVFAVDSQGNPVYDLQKEEIELYAAGKPVDIFYFNSYQVAEQVKNGQEKDAPLPAPVKSPERINFIILDTLLGNKNTMELNRAVALGIINNAAPGDAFIILDSNQVRGLQYIIGPEKDNKALTKALNDIEKLYVQRRVQMSADLLGEYSKISGNAKDIMEAIWGGERELVKRERERYQCDIRVLAQSLEQLKYALKTITLPKTVFLITTGPMKEAMDDIPVTYYRFLEDAARAINLGGSMLVVINPLMTKSKTAGTELKFMTDEVGGKCIHGTNLEDIVTKIKNSTSAYYELAFYPEQTNDPKRHIILKCKREGVELISIGYSEKGKPYRQMDAIEKKLFALNIINGGAWSRMAAKVGRIKFAKIKNTDQAPGETIEISMPPMMCNCQLDKFMVYLDPTTQKAALTFEQNKMGEKALINAVPMEKQQLYFVIIEPITSYCVYNRVF